MKPRNRLYLVHIADAISAIKAFTWDGRDAFFADLKTQSAVIRQLEIIGEAAKQLSQELAAANPQVPWRQIAGTHDPLIHAYFRVDLGAVWSTVEQHLPALRAEVARMRGANWAGPPQRAFVVRRTRRKLLRKLAGSQSEPSDRAHC